MDLSKKDSWQELLPDIDIAGHIVGWMHELGFYGSGGMSISPLSWLELKAWADLTRTAVTPDEARMMINMSKAFVAQYHRSSSPAEPLPHDKNHVETPDEATARLKAQIRGR